MERPVVWCFVTRSWGCKEMAAEEATAEEAERKQVAAEEAEELVEK